MPNFPHSTGPVPISCRFSNTFFFFIKSHKGNKSGWNQTHKLALYSNFLKRFPYNLINIFLPLLTRFSLLKKYFPTMELITILLKYHHDDLRLSISFFHDITFVSLRKCKILSLLSLLCPRQIIINVLAFHGWTFANYSIQWVEVKLKIDVFPSDALFFVWLLSDGNVKVSSGR